MLSHELYYLNDVYAQQLSSLFWIQELKIITIDLLRQVRRLGGVLLGVHNESVNVFLTYTFYTPKVTFCTELKFTL